jgi:hypothetical protein
MDGYQVSFGIFDFVRIGGVAQLYDLLTTVGATVRYPTLAAAFKLVCEGIAVVMGLEASSVLFPRAVSVLPVCGNVTVTTGALAVG